MHWATFGENQTAAYEQKYGNSKCSVCSITSLIHLHAPKHFFTNLPYSPSFALSASPEPQAPLCLISIVKHGGGKVMI